MKQYLPTVEIIEEEYEIPHLDVKRRISAVLPHDYESSGKQYPVLYLQDGQNLFNRNATFGDWAIDLSLQKLASNGFGDIIVVAIDHGEQTRIKEYLPYFHPEFGEGQGTAYIQFLKEKLIPYVNQKFRVLTDYGNTGIGGSSMGGLISLFAGLTEPDVFGKMMIFSPSLWISNMIYRHAESFSPRPESKIYLYAGGKESLAHLPNVKRLEKILRRKSFHASFFDIELSINKEGEHSENYWREEFPNAVKWLYYNEEKNSNRSA